MNAVRFLYAAYIATWAIHVFYIGTLVRRFSRLRREMKELGKGEVGSLPSETVHHRGHGGTQGNHHG